MFECCVNLGMCEGECCDLMNVVCICGFRVGVWLKVLQARVGCSWDSLFTALCALKSV